MKSTIIIRRLDAGMDVAFGIERHKSGLLAAAVLAPAVLSGILAAFRESLTAATAVLLLVLPVIAAASTGVRTAGILAAVSGGLSFDFFLTEPYGRLTINDPNDVEAALILVVIGAAVTEVALWGHRQHARASRRAGYLDGVLATAEMVTLQHDRPEALIERVSHEITQVLGVGRCRFVALPLRDPRTPILDHRGLVTRLGKPIDVDRNGLPTDDETALVVSREGVPVGHFLVNTAADITRPTLEQRRVAVLLADQVGHLVG